MSIKYAPYIDGTLPAFCGNTLKVPFETNLVVGSRDTLYAKIMDLNNNLIETLQSSNIELGIVVFNTTKTYIIDSYYKIQLSYANDGVWSTVGIAKYTATPEATIEQDTNNNYHFKGFYHTTDSTEPVYSYEFILKGSDNAIKATSGEKFLNSSLHQQGALWVIKCDYFANRKIDEGDKIELKVKTINGLEVNSGDYEFYNEPEEDRPEQFQALPSAPGVPVNMNSCSEEGLFQKELTAEQEDFTFYRSETSDFEEWITFDSTYFENVESKNIEFYPLTINTSEFTFTFNGEYSVGAEILPGSIGGGSALELFEDDGVGNLIMNWGNGGSLGIIGVIDYKNGIIKIKNNYYDPIENPNKTEITITFDKIVKNTTKSNASKIFKDNTIEQNKSYYYRVSSNIDVEGMASGPASLDFEHMYLSDAHHQLCIRLNPKVSNFKSNILESKTDTIGGKYPFFFRNENSGYKEIGIQGMISYYMDEQEIFIRKTDLGLAAPEAGGNTPTTNLSGYNMYAERKFREEVYKWLTNGQPKLFRSPAEGNYIVRLMNVSLTSPEDKLSRLLYSFSATGYEIQEQTAENLKNLIFRGLE